METARFAAPLALVRDRFVLAVGGMTSRTAKTNTCECYDSVTNNWFPINELPSPVANTSCAVMNSRFVYVMPAANTSSNGSA